VVNVASGATNTAHLDVESTFAVHQIAWIVTGAVVAVGFTYALALWEPLGPGRWAVNVAPGATNTAH
jgi:hypothetical protein